MWYIAFSVVFISIVYYIFYMPLHIKHEEVNDKKSAVNRARKLRKFGSKIPPPYPNGWFHIANSSEIKAGKSVNVDCLGENFVVFRSSKTNEVFVLDAYCPHMGANLGIGGVVVEDETYACIECPFHQWRFSGESGQCINIPYTDNFTEVEKHANVRKWISSEKNGLIFIWYHAENAEPWEIPTIEKIENEKFILHGSNEFLVHSHIQDIPENGADIAHLETVHGANILSGWDIRKLRNSWLSFGTHIWNAKWSQNEDKKHLATIKISHVFKISAFKLFQLEVDVTQIGPGYVHLVMKSKFGKITILQTLTPIEPMLQKLNHYFYASHFLGLVVKIFIWAETINVARDVIIWNNKKFIKNPLIVKEEKSLKLFRNWFSQFYSENSMKFSEAYKSNMDW